MKPSWRSRPRRTRTPWQHTARSGKPSPLELRLWRRRWPKWADAIPRKRTGRHGSRRSWTGWPRRLGLGLGLGETGQSGRGDTRGIPADNASHPDANPAREAAASERVENEEKTAELRASLAEARLEIAKLQDQLEILSHSHRQESAANENKEAALVELEARKRERAPGTKSSQVGGGSHPNPFGKAIVAKAEAERRKAEQRVLGAKAEVKTTENGAATLIFHPNRRPRKRF